MSRFTIRDSSSGSCCTGGSRRLVSHHDGCGVFSGTLTVVRRRRRAVPLLQLRPAERARPEAPWQRLRDRVRLDVTGGPLAHNAGVASTSGKCAPTHVRLRLYRGATPDDSVHGMFSFFPAIPAGDEVGFPRPLVDLPDEYFNRRNFRSPKGQGKPRHSSTHCRSRERPPSSAPRTPRGLGPLGAGSRGQSTPPVATPLPAHQMLRAAGQRP